MIRWLLWGDDEMYLTRMYLNFRRRSAMKLLDSPQCMHAAIAHVCPPDSYDPSQSRVLWRIDRQQDRIGLFVVTPVEPDLSNIVEQAGWQTGEMWQTRPYGPLLDSLEKKQIWEFRLTANPTHSARKEGWSDTKPIGHVTVKQQLDWFTSRAEKWGFSLPCGAAASTTVAVTERRTMRFSRKGGPGVVLSTASYQGILQVADPILLRGSLVNGIGRAKAYGCGLMTLAPVRSG